ncbi:hypothetical protein BaRGS_00023898 [Batillaria attramentaria]|uniref:Uncharacterized protein n=1 Tax=Batillaria attramentaria TaxID=370345 RepID=A0ABD0KCL9_9CAEN
MIMEGCQGKETLPTVGIASASLDPTKTSGCIRPQKLPESSLRLSKEVRIIRSRTHTCVRLLSKEIRTTPFKIGFSDLSSRRLRLRWAAVATRECVSQFLEVFGETKDYNFENITSSDFQIPHHDDRGYYQL